jgi:predicted site-specific integrase-resolvase
MGKNFESPKHPAEKLLDDAAAAEILGVQPRTLRLWRNTRRLPFLKISSRVVRYRLADLNAWLDASRTVIS